MLIKTGVNATFRMKRSLFWLGVGGALFYGGLSVAGFAFALTGPTVKHRLGLAAGLGGLPLSMAGLALWILAAYRREVLTLQGDRLIFQGIFRRTEIALRDATAARWIVAPDSGRLALLSKNAGCTVHFSYYLPEERARLVEALRAGLDPAVQTGWNVFAYKTGIRERRTVRLKPNPDEILLRRDRWDRYLVPSLLALGVASLVSWRLTGRPGAFALPLALIPGWGVLRTCWPAEGVVLPRLTAASGNARFLWIMLLWSAVGTAGAFALTSLRPKLAHPEAIMVVAAVLWMAVLVFEGGLEDRRRRLSDQEAADLAAKARGDLEVDREWSV